jgi:K(+)-stimulated pyrophosphate-energized sodium pump
MLSTVVPLLLIVITILVAYELGGNYGVSLTALGMLAPLGVTMSCDAYGPIADNAGGIAEMTESMPKSVREKTDMLDALGNTTAATGKGFANGSAVLTALSTAVAFAKDAGINLVTGVNLIDRFVVCGILLGALLPYVFSALTMLAVGRAAEDMIREVRDQFRRIPGLKEKALGLPMPAGVDANNVRAEYKRCVVISTTASLVEMIIPGALAVLTPLAVGYLMGAWGLLGLLVGAIASGYLLGVMMSNTGGAWDNAKKYVETGALTCQEAKDQAVELGNRYKGDELKAAKKKIRGFHSKGSDTHAAAVSGDTVGDPFKDTSGPSLNILIKIQTRFALVFATVFPTRAAKGDYNDGDFPKWAVGLCMLGALFVILLFMYYKMKADAGKKEGLFADEVPDPLPPWPPASSQPQPAAAAAPVVAPEEPQCL